ncbi:MAG TPA: TIGR02147 family protein [Bdellovibrio sp.]|nr:TIGR02147 family protein [Bdellovibrio sp.]
MTSKSNVFNYLDFREFLSASLQGGPRGMQAQMARATHCQAIHINNVTKGKAQFTEDQAYRVGQFLKLSEAELGYFMDLIRLDRAADSETKQYFKKNLQARSAAQLEIKNRVSGVSLPTSTEQQIQYFCTPLTSLVHIATSCPQLQTAEALAKWLQADLEEINKILEFLTDLGLVEFKNKKFSYSGKSIHLGKDSVLHPLFQKNRREFVLKSLPTKNKEQGIHFSSAFATTETHLKKIKEKLLEFIDETHNELTKTESEKVSILVIDFLKL